MQLSDIGIVFEGARKDPEMYGTDYIPEFCRVLDQYVPAAKRILEWGSGLTSQVLTIYGEWKWRSELFLSIDENCAYQEAVFCGGFRRPFVKSVCIDRVGPRRGQADPELNYSSYPLASGTTFDMIFIDGRRRMECALVASILSHPQTILILHDYRRTRYQSILALFERVEDGPQFRVMRPRADMLTAIRPGADLVQAVIGASQP